MTDSRSERGDLSGLLSCLRCRGPIVAGNDHMACSACGQSIPIIDGIPYVRDANEDPAIDRERRAVLDLEAGPSDFSLASLLSAGAALRAAFLSLPYDDGSDVFKTIEYFRNVAVFAGPFDFVVDGLGLPAGSRVLDVGADLTWSTARLARKGWRPVGIDINHHLAASRLFRQEGIDYAVLNMDMHLAAFRDGVFDGITAFNALHHTHRLEPLVANLARMVRPGGRLGFVEPYWFLEQVRQAFGAAQIEAGINENVYRLEEWHATLVNHGFEVVSFIAAHAFSAVYERVSESKVRRLSLDQARDELFEPFYSARVTTAGARAYHASPGTSVMVPIRVLNSSSRIWCRQSQIPVSLGYHLYVRSDGPGMAPTRTAARFENPRTDLGEYLRPGEEAAVELRVDVPEVPGRYELEIDLVHEGVTWFAGRGLEPLHIELTVQP